MKIEHRSLTDDGHRRPQPEVFQMEDRKTLAIITNWGSPACVAITKDVINSVMTPEVMDMDATQVNTRIAQTLSAPASLEWKLRESLKKINDEILKRENAAQWKSIIEVFVIHEKNNGLYWAHAGTPNLWRFSQNKFDLLAVNPESELPLPLCGLGLDAFPSVNSGTLDTDANSTFFLVSSFRQESLQAMFPTGITPNLQVLSQFLTSMGSGPAWLAQISL